MNTNIKDRLNELATHLEKPWMVGTFVINGYEQRKVWHDCKTNKYSVTTITGDTVNDGVPVEYDSFDAIIAAYSSLHNVGQIVNMSKSRMTPYMMGGV